MQNKGQRVDYTPFSADDQNETRQLEAIGEVDLLLSEEVRGKNTKRAQLQEILAYVRAGDSASLRAFTEGQSGP